MRPFPTLFDKRDGAPVYGVPQGRLKPPCPDEPLSGANDHTQSKAEKIRTSERSDELIGRDIPSHAMKPSANAKRAIQARTSCSEVTSSPLANNGTGDKHDADDQDGHHDCGMREKELHIVKTSEVRPPRRGRQDRRRGRSGKG